MKKLVSLLLAVCMCLFVCLILTACGNEEHTHTYKTEWSKDTTHHWHACEGEDCTDVSDKAEHSFTDGVCVCGYEQVATHTCVFETEWSKDTTHHWHACEGEDCTDVSDKAEHTWNEGEITTEATAEADGEKTFACTVCGKLKTESVGYVNKNTVTESEWDSIFSETTFRNVTVIYTYSSSATKYDTQIQLTDGKIYLNSVQESSISVMQGSLGTTNASMALKGKFSQFNYNETENCYCGSYFVPNETTGTNLDCEIYFENGVLKAMSLTYSDESFEFSYSDFGTTVVDTPAVSTTVTKEEWKQAFSNAAETNNLTYTWNQIAHKGSASNNDGFMKVHKDGNKIFIEGGCGANGENCYTLCENNTFYHYTQDDEGVWSKTQVESQMHIPNLADVLTPFADLRESFAFSKENLILSATSVEVMGMDMEADVKIENGNLTYLRFKIFTGYSDDEPTWVTTIYKFADYGTTVVDIPVVSTTVTEEEWETAFDFDCSFLQAKIFEADLAGEAEYIITEDGIRYVETYGYSQWYACYMEKVDNGLYVYEGEAQSGNSIEDIKSYSKKFYTFDEATMYLFTEDAYKVYTAPFADCYENFRYDEESQIYVADSIILSGYKYDEKLGYADVAFSDVNISFDNGKIKKVSYTETQSYSDGDTNVDTICVEFYYDTIEIIFPQAK